MRECRESTSVSLWNVLFVATLEPVWSRCRWLPLKKESLNYLKQLRLWSRSPPILKPRLASSATTETVQTRVRHNPLLFQRNRSSMMSFLGFEYFSKGVWNDSRGPLQLEDSQVGGCWSCPSSWLLNQFPEPLPHLTHHHLKYEQFSFFHGLLGSLENRNP